MIQVNSKGGKVVIVLYLKFAKSAKFIHVNINSWMGHNIEARDLREEDRFTIMEEYLFIDNEKKSSKICSIDKYL